MSDYKTPRPLPSASASDPCVVYDNSVSFDKLINESEVVTTYKGVKLQSVPSLLDQIEAEASAAVISLGWTPVGEFATGFTYAKLNDVGRDASGSWWRYNGSDLPKVITAGTVPSSPNFSVISFETADNVSKNGGGSVQDFIDSVSAVFATVAEMTAATPKSGSIVEIVERGGAAFEVGVGAPPDGFGRLDVGQVGLRAKYLQRGKAYAHHFGVVGDGVVDDADASNAALGLVSTLYVTPAPVEYLTSRIRMTSGSSIIGEGLPKFKLRGQDWGDTQLDSAAVFVFGRDVRDAGVYGVFVDGNRGNHTATNLTNVECVDVDGYNNTVSGCVLYNAQSDGIDCDGADISKKQGNKFLFNKIYDCGGYGIHNSIYSNGNFVVGNEVWNCGFGGSRGGIDSYYGDAVSKSFGGHVIIGNKCYDNYQNYSIRSEHPSLFVGNISEGGSIADNLSGVYVALSESQIGAGVDLATVLTPGDYIVPAGTVGLPIDAGCSMAVRTTRGSGLRVSQTVTYATNMGVPDDSRVFMRGYDSVVGFGVWKELTNTEDGKNVGEFKFLQKTTSGLVNAGDVVNGADLVDSTLSGGITGTAMAGTWRAQGICGGIGSPVADRVARFIRVT